MGELVGWIDPDTAFADWADAPEPEELLRLTKTAYIKAAAWAPKPLPLGTPEDPIPANYETAQILLTQHLAARKRAGDGQGFGADGFMMQTYPLVREAYDALRPKSSPFAGLL
jgi:hypothetical protein